MSIRPTARPWKLESLESREMLAADVGFDPATEVLTLYGSSGHDWFDVRTDGETLQVYQDVNRGQLSSGLVTPDADLVFEIDRSRVAEIKFLGRAGDDYLNNHTWISVNANGGTGNDRLEGGFGDDLLRGGPGHDLLKGWWGNDQLAGGTGNDTLHGSRGNDRIFGGAGFDFAYGDDGNDRIATHTDDDRVYGGDGNDRIFLGSGDDHAEGGAGNDRIAGHGGDDELIGGDGHDRLFGGSGRNRLEGNDGNDFLRGGDGEDRILGGDGVDKIFGMAGDDWLDAGLGGIFNGPGNFQKADKVFGGAGDDVIEGIGGWKYLVGEDGADEITGGGFGRFHILGGSGNDTLQGSVNIDFINGGSGNDTLRGGHGDDTLVPGSGNDRVEAGDGIDTVTFSSSKSDFSFSGTVSVKFLDLFGSAIQEGTNTVTGAENVSFAGVRYWLDSLLDEDGGSGGGDGGGNGGGGSGGGSGGGTEELYWYSPTQGGDTDKTHLGFKAYTVNVPASGRYFLNLSNSSTWFTESSRLTLELKDSSGRELGSAFINNFRRSDNIVFQADADETYLITLAPDGLQDASFRLTINRAFG